MSLLLKSLTEWSQSQISAVFESPDDHEAIRAIQETFSPSIKASLNGKQLGFTDIRNMVLSLRHSSPSGLKVHWLQTVEAPQDATHRNGSLGGSYVINGIHKIQGGRLVEHCRQKAVIVKIESQSHDCSGDSRRIVMLHFVASDVPIEE